jgi:hypothetical protein
MKSQLCNIFVADSDSDSAAAAVVVVADMQHGLSGKTPSSTSMRFWEAIEIL